jgi:hypothetical protein
MFVDLHFLDHGVKFLPEDAWGRLSYSPMLSVTLTSLSTHLIRKAAFGLHSASMRPMHASMQHARVLVSSMKNGPVAHATGPSMPDPNFMLLVSLRVP